MRDDFKGGPFNLKITVKKNSLQEAFKGIILWCVVILIVKYFRNRKNCTTMKQRKVI
ncbi:TPA: hypothetical protein R1902_002281 [Staphylococcus delphini]|nr:hypothetical protein [Staphylococcus delphini]HEC2150274.1 hypothetical protein [Staphylococcus delphini]HEC2161217.1 hypothetical protein [Staphylococcus delphini]HEC2169213.1 hypothetical protein [Staphylococcus delphini]HEC2171675.1 hypothetical protein [Staphylococcus delphini]